jgi:hypothetical protein
MGIQALEQLFQLYVIWNKSFASVNADTFLPLWELDHAQMQCHQISMQLHPTMAPQITNADTTSKLLV